jgi:hypothetical protein
MMNNGGVGSDFHEPLSLAFPSIDASTWGLSENMLTLSGLILHHIYAIFVSSSQKPEASDVPIETWKLSPRPLGG